MDTQQKIKMTPLPEDILDDSKYDLLDELKEKTKQCVNIFDKFCYKTLKKLGYKGLLSEEKKLENFIVKNNIVIANKNNGFPIITWILKDKEIKSVLIIYELNLYGKGIDYREEFFI